MDVGRIGDLRSLVLEADEVQSPAFPLWSPEELHEKLALPRGEALIVDLSRVKRAKSDLFGWLARIKALVGEQGSPMVLLMGDPALGRTLELLGLDRVFRITWDRDEALEACGARRSSASRG